MRTSIEGSYNESMPYSVFVAVALAIHIFINVMMFVKNDNMVAIKSYRLFLISIALFYVSDILWGVFEANKWANALYVDTFIYFILMGSTVLFWTGFVIRFLEGNRVFSQIVRWVGVAFFVAEIVLLIVNIFVSILFSVDKNAVYSAYPARDIMLYTQIGMYALVALYSIIYTVTTHIKEYRRYIAICLFSLVMIVCIAIQIGDPYIPFYSIGCLIGVCIVNTYSLDDIREGLKAAYQETSRLKEEKEKTLDKVITIAYHDALTGVKSRHAFVEEEERIDKMISNHEINEFAAVVFDINGLKETNDRLGHEAGDKVILDAAKVIASFYPAESIFRFGGDEFIVILVGEDYKKRHTYNKQFTHLMENNAQSGGLVISSGMAQFRPGVDNTFNTVFYRADKMMYSHKEHLKDAQNAAA